MSSSNEEKSAFSSESSAGHRRPRANGSEIPLRGQPVLEQYETPLELGDLATETLDLGNLSPGLGDLGRHLRLALHEGLDTDPDRRDHEEVAERGERHQAGHPEDARIPVYLGLANEEGHPHPGMLDFVDNQVNPRTGTLRVRGVFPNKDETFSPGFFARVRVPIGSPHKALLVSDRALDTDQGQKVVYALDKDNKVVTTLAKTFFSLGLVAIRPNFRGIGASDFIVSLGSFENMVGTALQQSGTLMHELGHNLSLRHGGGDDTNYKPNYLSVEFQDCFGHWLFEILRAPVGVTHELRNVLMGAIFFGLLTPVNLVFRRIGRDALRRGFDHRADSYWIRRAGPPPVARYFRQF